MLVLGSVVIWNRNKITGKLTCLLLTMDPWKRGTIFRFHDSFQGCNIQLVLYTFPGHIQVKWLKLLFHSERKVAKNPSLSQKAQDDYVSVCFHGLTCGDGKLYVARPCPSHMAEQVFRRPPPSDSKLHSISNHQMKIEIWVLNQKIGDFTPKMDGENNGTPY